MLVFELAGKVLMALVVVEVLGVVWVVEWVDVVVLVIICLFTCFLNIADFIYLIKYI